MRIVKKLKFASLLLLGLCAGEKVYAQWGWNASNGTEVKIIARGSDDLDVRWYGLQVHPERGWSDSEWRFVYGNNSENDRVQGDELLDKRPNFKSNSMYCWVFQKVGNSGGNDASALALWNRTGAYMYSQGNGRPSLSSSTYTILRLNTPEQDDWKSFKMLYGNDTGSAAEINKEMTVWKNSAALEFKGPMRPDRQVAYFRIFDVDWSDREAVIYNAMKNAVGAYAGTAAGDFTAIDAEYNKDMLVRNFRDIRTKFSALQERYLTYSTSLPSGFYRIKNGSSSFYRQENATTGFYELSGEEERVMYVDAADKKVKWAKKSLQDGVWRVINNNNGTYTLTHYNTGYTFTTPTGEAVLGGKQTVQIQSIYQKWFPGYYSIIAGVQHAHAGGRITGSNLNNSGSVISYNRAEGTRTDNLYRNYETATEYPSASSWLFVPETRTIPNDVRVRAKELLAAKDVARGFRANQLVRLEELLNNPLALPKEINDEIDRLLDERQTPRIPFEDGFYTVINAHPDFENKTNRLLYADPQSAPLWHINATPTTRDVWYVEKTSNGKYIFTNVNSTLTINGTTSRLRGKAYDMTAFEINANKYPARFLIHDQAYTYMHANNHHATTDHPNGTIIGYHDGTAYQRLDGQGTVDGASAWKLKPLDEASVPASADFNTIVERHKASENRVFGYTTAQLQTLKSATQTGAKFKAIYNMRKAGRIRFDVNGFNRIYNGATKYASNLKTIYLDYAANAPKWHSGDQSKVDELWKIKPLGSGTNNYAVSNPNTSTYISGVTSMSPTSAACRFEELDGYTLPSILKLSAGNSVFNPHGNGDNHAGGSLGHWDSPATSDANNYIYVNAANGNEMRIDQTSTWYVVPAKQIDLITSILPGGQPKKFFTTFYYPFSVELPAELGTRSTDSMWGYIERNGASSEHTGYVLVKPVPGKKIKARTPMVIETKTHQSVIPLKIIPDAEATVEMQSVVWRGVLAPENVPVGTYIMINHTAWSGFYKTTEAGLISPNRVYIPATRSASAPYFVELWDNGGDEEDTTTGISEVKTTEKNTSEPIIYDLTGRRVKKAEKGIYVTSDGKKIYKP
ncbi:MAG: hypothetical protein PUK67_04150 [Prevotellaceae bacterium]|nr:hypothetical protein [Prevotellaceae bacterium]MDY3365568.1 hypothetical protein [Prevotella sp.]